MAVRLETGHRHDRAGGLRPAQPRRQEHGRDGRVLPMPGRDSRGRPVGVGSPSPQRRLPRRSRTDRTSHHSPRRVGHHFTRSSCSPVWQRMQPRPGPASPPTEQTASPTPAGPARRQAGGASRSGSPRRTARPGSATTSSCTPPPPNRRRSSSTRVRRQDPQRDAVSWASWKTLPNGSRTIARRSPYGVSSGASNGVAPAASAR
ncbi:MAG: hypothetical protein QOI86_5189 [Actinomycetota bacterium]|nr:hypothetical protein [Actinomycetota bacterium]